MSTVRVLVVDGIGGLERNLSPDAESFGDVAARRWHGADIAFLHHEDFTERSLALALTRLRSLAADFTVFYYTGHGHSNEFESYLVTPDGVEGAEGYALSSVIKGLPRGDGQSWLALLDCCHVDNEQYGWVRGQLNVPAALQGGGGGSDRAILAASTASSEAVLIPGQRSPFTAAACEALDGAGATRSGDVSLGSLHGYVAQQLLSQGLPEPSFSGDLRSTFVLTSGVEPGDWESDQSPQSVSLDAERYAQSVHAHVDAVDADWQTSGWQSTARKLEPVVRWFRKYSTRPELKRNEQFIQAKSIVDRYHRYVATVSQGIETGHGTVIRVLGKGGFGSVWTLADEKGNESKAIKIYTPDELHNTEKVARFARGYRAMKQLNHPGIVGVTDFLEVPAAIVMDKVPGSDLEAWNPLTEPNEVLDFVEQMARILKYSHSQEVIHRDLKPANVIAVNEGDLYLPVITDFDLAWFSTATQLTRVSMGWAFYAAPEQIQSPTSSATRLPSVDVYSLMQILFYLLTNKDPRPFDVQHNGHSLTRTLEDQWDLNERADEVVALYLDGSVQIAAQRIQSMDEVIRRLENLRRSRESSEPAVYSFQAFFQRAAMSANWKELRTSGNAKWNAQSPTTRSSFEAILEEARSEIIVRVKTFELAGCRNPQNMRNFRTRNQKRIDAGLAAIPGSVPMPVPNTNLSFLQARFSYEKLDKRTANQFSAFVRKIYSAMERVN